MDAEALLDLMRHNTQRIRTLVAGTSDAQARWKPDAETWSILEVINHLDDEERLDFRVRLDHILHQPGQPWPPIDPPGWVTEHRYNERDLDDSLASFLRERQQSLDWLQSLGTPNWSRSETAPWGGTLSAGDMFAAWVAHDTLHLRQLVELHHAYVEQLAAPYHTQYAGDW
ncbi:MAG: DinB family protein [Anaerolineae bacterium]|nr:DinB family protein [Anaerolineae bacterium]